MLKEGTEYYIYALFYLVAFLTWLVRAFCRQTYRRLQGVQMFNTRFSVDTFASQCPHTLSTAVSPACLLDALHCRHDVRHHGWHLRHGAARLVTRTSRVLRGMPAGWLACSCSSVAVQASAALCRLFLALRYAHVALHIPRGRDVASAGRQSPLPCSME